MDAVNIYCDESGHLEHDASIVPTMVLGALTCPTSKAREVARRVREIKAQHGLSPTLDLKWTKVSKGQQALYLALLDYFFDDDDLGFRALVIPDKARLDHERFSNQAHDDWYYKMYFRLVRNLILPPRAHYVYLDIKDTRSQEKVRRLHTYLANSAYDFDRSIVRRIQTVRSEEVQQVQLADLLIGAVSYAHRKLQTNDAKLAFVGRFRERSKRSLLRSTLPSEQKVNIFVWNPA